MTDSGVSAGSGLTLVDVQPQDRLFNPDLFVDGTDPYDRARFLAGAFIATYSNKSTRKGHAQVLREWISWLHEYVPAVAPIGPDVRRVHIDLYMRWLEQKGLEVATVARKVSVLAAFYRYLQGEDYVVRNPVDAVRRPQVPKESTREFLTPRELADFVDHAETEGGYPYALCAVLALNGLRVSEILNADIEDLGKERYHHTLRIVGKGNKPDIIAIPARAFDAIQQAIGDRDHGPLILNRRHHRMDRAGAGLVVRRIATQVAPDKQITPHSIRHSAITAYLTSGADISAGAAYARHADTRTTQRYDRRRRKLDASGSYAVSNYLANF